MIETLKGAVESWGRALHSYGQIEETSIMLFEKDVLAAAVNVAGFTVPAAHVERTIPGASSSVTWYCPTPSTL